MREGIKRVRDLIGKRVRIRKPDDVHEAPVWVEHLMNKFDGEELVVTKEMVGTELSHLWYGGWNFNINWLEVVEPKEDTSVSGLRVKLVKGDGWVEEMDYLDGAVIEAKDLHYGGDAHYCYDTWFIQPADIVPVAPDTKLTNPVRPCRYCKQTEDAPEQYVDPTAIWFRITKPMAVTDSPGWNDKMDYLNGAYVKSSDLVYDGVYYQVKNTNPAAPRRNRWRLHQRWLSLAQPPHQTRCYGCGRRVPLKLAVPSVRGRHDDPSDQFVPKVA